MGPVTALVASAGKGLRMASNIEKPFLEICGIPILAHTLAALDQCPEIDSYVIVADPGRQEDCMKRVVNAYGFTRARKVVAGGATRQESIFLGLQSLGSDTDCVVIHDAARPCVPPSLISATVASCETTRAVLAAVPVKDTVKIVTDGIVSGTPDRDTLWLAQTPQTFSYDLVLGAHEQALRDGFTGTDDASLVERLGHPVSVIRGDYENLKITTPEDLEIAEKILADRKTESPLQP